MPGSIAAQAPTLATLDLLAKCYDSSARLSPTIDVVPLFPFLLDNLAGKIYSNIFKCYLLWILSGL